MRTKHEIEVEGEFVDITVTWLIENETEYYEVGNQMIQRPYQIITPLYAESKDDCYYLDGYPATTSFEKAVDEAWTNGYLDY